MPRRLIGAALIWAATVLPGAAQGVDGVWTCQLTHDELNHAGARISGFDRRYALILHPDGTFLVQGAQKDAGGRVELQGFGAWQMSGGILTARGQGGALPFMMMARLELDGTLSDLYEQRDGSGGGIRSRTRTLCARAQ